MKKISYLLTVIVLAMSLSSSSCKKENNPSSEWVTVNGQTLGCKVNGSPFIADKWDYGNNVPPIHVDFWYNPIERYRYLIVSGNRSNERIEIYLNPPLITGRRELKFTTLSHPTIVNPRDYGYYSTQVPAREYITNETVGGYVDIISIDTILQKIEARFEFTGTDKNTGEKVIVTNGYFKRE